tara:strand:- start:110 stop:748 length:639 start_codon:yes stop_codon:yes gene_type:complete
MAVQNTLPDPNNQITDAGESGSGSTGPGFKSVQLSSIQPILRDRTNSGRIVSRAHAYHKWDISITYNPLTKEEFDPVYNFLLHKRGTLKPFFVSLPQYRAQGPTSRTVASNAVAGATSLTSAGSGGTAIKPGMLFTITDSSDSSHTKAYIITQVNGTALTISPGLAKAVTGGATLDFADPKIKVVQTSDTRQYSLDVNNLYTFSLKLEEASQ